MARYQSNGGGTFVKFLNVGDKHEGTFLGTRSLPNKFKGGAMETVVDIMRADGTKISLRLDKKDLLENYGLIVPPPQPGERICFTFEGTYPSKFGQPGKRIPIDMPDRPDTPGTATPEAPVATSGDEVEAAYADVVKAKGDAAAKAIRAAVEKVAAGDKAQQAKLLKQAVGA